MNEFYLRYENGGAPATYTIANGMIEILFSEQRLVFSYVYDLISFTVGDAILTDDGDVFLIVSDVDVYILRLSQGGTDWATVGHSLASFLVIKGEAYLLYNEEGVFHEYSNNELNGYSCNGLVKWNLTKNKMEKVLTDQFGHQIVDGNSFCYDGKENLLIFYYGEVGDDYGTCCLKYSLATNQGEHFTVPSYYYASCYHDNRCFCYDGKGIAELNSEFKMVRFTALDVQGVSRVIGGYQELVVIKKDKSYSIQQ